MPNVETNASCCRLLLEEEMTIYTASDLKDKLFAAVKDHANTELDLSQVCEIDAAGLQILVLLKREAKRLRKTVSFTRLSPAVQELLSVFGMDTFFDESEVAA